MARTTYRAALTAVVAVAACQPAASSSRLDVGPRRLEANTSPRAALRAVAQELTRSGFLVTATDSTTQLRAEREGRAGEPAAGIECRSAADPVLRASVVPTLMLLVTARPLQDGRAEVVVASRARASYLRLTADPARPSSDTDCHSTGDTERQLVAALGGESH